MSSNTLRQRAREMRNNPTEPENRLWQALKGKQLEGFKFRRQTVLGQRIVDFYCPLKALVIEVDGGTHDAVTDARRDECLLRDFEVRTIRFTNDDVMRNLEGVLVRLAEAMGASNHPPTPSFSEEGE